MKTYTITIQQALGRGHKITVDMGNGLEEYAMLADDIKTVMEGLSEFIVEKHNNTWTYDRNGGEIKNANWGYVFYNGAVTTLKVYGDNAYFLRGNHKKKYDAVFPDKIKCLEVFTKNKKHKIIL